MAKKQTDTARECENILNEMKTGQYKPVYFLYGGEGYYIDKISHYAEHHILNEAEKGFNLNVIYGKDITGPQLVSICKRFPMLGKYQVVVLKEAQQMKEADYLLHYLAAPVPSTLLFICWKSEKFDKRTKIGKALSTLPGFESAPLYENQLPAFITQVAATHQLKINPRAAALLGGHLGNDLAVLTNEIDKLALSIKKGGEITENDIETHSGISREFNVFELQKSLSKRDFSGSFRIAHFLCQEGKNTFIAAITTLYTFFSNVYIGHDENDKSSNGLKNNLGLNFFQAEDISIALRNYNISQVEQVMKLLLEYDLKSKGVDNTGIPESELYKELIYKITSL